MSIERERWNGPIYFECEWNRCTEIAETECTDFSGALAKVKSRGWCVARSGDKWLHFCPDHAHG